MYHPRLQGQHYDMGFHYGALLNKNGLSFNNIIQLTTEQMEFGLASLEVCEKLVPNICSELKACQMGLIFRIKRWLHGF